MSAATGKKAVLQLDGKEIELPIYSGTLGPDVIDVKDVLASGHFTFDPGFMAGVTIAVLVGCSWYVVNWYMFGDLFIDRHFKTAHMKIIQGNYFVENPLYLLGYFKDMLKNYWPWLPFTVMGVFLFAKRGFKEKNPHSMPRFRC